MQSEWQSIGSNLYCADYDGGPLAARSVAIQTASGILVVSPGKGLDKTVATDGPGKPSFLLAPSSLHNNGLAQWRAAFPEAQAYAHPDAHKSLRNKGHSDLLDATELPGVCNGAIEIISLPHNPAGEVIVQLRAGDHVTWVVCDVFFNLTEHVKTLPMRILGAIFDYSPKLRITGLYKMMGIKNKPAFRDWMLETIAQSWPTRLIPAHGAIIEDPALPDRLIEAVNAALG